MTGRRGVWSGNSEEVTGTAWPHNTKDDALFLKLREKEEQERHGLSTKGAAGVLGESSFSAFDT